MRKPTKPGELKDVRLKLWRAIVAAERAMYRAEEKEDNDRVLRAVHALSQASGQYGRLIEAGELNERIEKLEQRAHLRKVA